MLRLLVVVILVGYCYFTNIRPIRIDFKMVIC